MECIVRPSVYPSASVAWNKHQGDLTKTVHLGENYAKQKAELKDCGTYVCRATNNPHKPLVSRLKNVVLYVYGKCIY